jgi:hypothetical protein
MEAVKMRVDVVWQALEWPSIEHVCIEASEDRTAGAWTPGPWTADGSTVAVVDGHPVRLTYRISVAADGTTRALDVGDTVGGASLSLRGDGNGRWSSADGAARPDLDGCIDVDISTTPLTNTLPIRRLALAVGDGAEIKAAYVDVPSLSVRPAEQRYSRLDDSTYRYSSGSFVADVSVDSDGVVTAYHGLWSRLPVSNVTRHTAGG